MGYSEAIRTVEDLRSNTHLTEEEEFEYIEALRYLIEETGRTRFMTELGGYYYEQKQFDLALKYYEMADLAGDEWAPEGLGYIWYYGRTGEKDYKKAFEYYSRASENGYIRSTIKVADMYKNGYYVDRDFDKYAEIIEGLYEMMMGAEYSKDPKPEVLTRLAAIRQSQGRIDEAVRLYMDARDFLAFRIRYNPFFGNLNMMGWLIRDLYELVLVDYADLRLFDMYEVLTRPTKVRFMYSRKSHEMEAVEESDGIAVRLDDKWYRSVEDMFRNAILDGERLAVLEDMLYSIEVVG